MPFSGFLHTACDLVAYHVGFQNVYLQEFVRLYYMYLCELQFRRGSIFMLKLLYFSSSYVRIFLSEGLSSIFLLLKSVHHFY